MGNGWGRGGFDCAVQEGFAEDVRCGSGGGEGGRREDGGEGELDEVLDGEGLDEFDVEGQQVGEVGEGRGAGGGECWVRRELEQEVEEAEAEGDGGGRAEGGGGGVVEVGAE